MRHASDRPLSRDGVRSTTSAAEQAVYRALAKGLPTGWTAWHSLRVRADRGVDRGLDGESDFVFAIPELGVLVLEVKGGAIEVRDGRWLQNGRPLLKAPREQAHGFVRKLVEKLRDRYRGHAPWIAVATAFPETSFDADPTHGDIAGRGQGGSAGVDRPRGFRQLPHMHTTSRRLQHARLPAWRRT